MITTGKIHALGKFFDDKVNATDLFPEHRDVKMWECSSTASGDNPFQIFEYVMADTLRSFKQRSALDATCALDPTSDQYDPLCGICANETKLLTTALNASGLEFMPVTGQTQPQRTALHGVLQCNLNEFGVGRFDVMVNKNDMWNITGNWQLIVSISMLGLTKYDTRLINLMPNDYSSALSLSGFPDFIGAAPPGEDKHLYFGLDFVQSFSLFASSVLRGTVYNCFMWQTTRKADLGNNLNHLGHRVKQDCFHTLMDEHDAFCWGYLASEGIGEDLSFKFDNSNSTGYRFQSHETGILRTCAGQAENSYAQCEEQLCLPTKKWPSLYSTIKHFECGTCQQVIAASCASNKDIDGEWTGNMKYQGGPVSCATYCNTFGHECFSAGYNSDGGNITIGDTETYACTTSNTMVDPTTSQTVDIGCRSLFHLDFQQQGRMVCGCRSSQEK